MREDKFYELMGEIDPEIIAAADRPVPFRQKRGFKIMLIAAVLAFVMLLTPVAGAFALVGYQVLKPDEGDVTDGAQGSDKQDLVPGGLVNELFGDIDWGRLKDAIGEDGNVDWGAIFDVLQGKDPDPDPASELFKSVELTDGTVMISEYLGDSETVVVPDKIMGKTVTVIGKNAFAENTSIKHLVLPDTVVKIDDHAFSLCSLLETVQLPQNIQVIGAGAFSKCFSLTDLYTGERSAQSPSIGADFPDSLHTLGNGAFEYCRNLTHAIISPTLKNWAYTSPFAGSGLETVTIMDGVTSIPGFAFSTCALKEISLPASVTHIGAGAFIFCAQLQSITLNEGLVTIESGAFDEVGISSIVIPSTVTELENVVFTGCTNLEQVIFAGDAPSIYERLYATMPDPEDMENVPDYTVYYRLGAEGFEDGDWNGHTCQLMTYQTEQFVKNRFKREHYTAVPMYNVEVLGDLSLSGLDEVTVLDSYGEYEAFSHVLTSTRYDRDYFKEFAIVLIHVQQCSSEQVLGLAGLGAQLYNYGGVSYLGLYPVVKFDCGEGDMTTDIFSTYVLAEVQRSDIRTDNIRRAGSVYAYDIHTQSSSAYHPGLVDKGK